MTDIFIVETSDHAKVSLSLTYSWHFKKPETQQDYVKLFNVKDFVGDACKSIASRIRGNISAIPFETLHYNSSLKIKEAVFGIDKVTK
jgi:major vault protein